MKTLTYALKKEWFNIIMLLLPFLAIPFLYHQFPAQMAFHWTLEGQADLFSDKSLVLTLIPVINVLLYFSFLQPAIAQNSPAPVLRTGVVIFLLLTQTWVILLNVGIVHSVIDLMSPVTAVILLLCGYYMRNNIPFDLMELLPWALDSQQNLQKCTHFMALLWILGGLIMLGSFPFVSKNNRINIWLITVFGMALLPVVYSFYLHKLSSAAK